MFPPTILIATEMMHFISAAGSSAVFLVKVKVAIFLEIRNDNTVKYMAPFFSSLFCLFTQFNITKSNSEWIWFLGYIGITRITGITGITGISFLSGACGGHISSSFPLFFASVVGGGRWWRHMHFLSSFLTH